MAIELIKRKMFHTEDLTSDSVGRKDLLNSHSVPIKAGWLLKKRDFIFGWQCRYFVVYVGRVEYYIDQHDQHPKGVIHLFGAEITTATKCSVNGVNDHWSISIEPRNRERAFRLASEFTGEEGMVDATSWVQVFMIAARPADSSSGLYGSLPPPRNVNPSDGNTSSLHTSDRGSIASMKSSRDKERVIRKNTDLVHTAIAVSVISIMIGAFVGEGFQSIFPSSSMITKTGIIALVACICFLSSFFLGLFDYRWTHMFFNVKDVGGGSSSGSSSSSSGRAIRRPSTFEYSANHSSHNNNNNKYSNATIVGDVGSSSSNSRGNSLSRSNRERFYSTPS